MKYEVRCECGTVHDVSAADAGASLRCTCGRTVDVPPLHMLRVSSGEMGVSPSIQLQAMLLKNELPGTNDCVCCHRCTQHLIRVSVVCERAITTDSVGKQDVAAGCLGALLLGLPGLLLVFRLRDGRVSEPHGTDLSFVLPVRMCEACERDNTAPAAVRKAMNATPIYAALFEQYPNALVRKLD